MPLTLISHPSNYYSAHGDLLYVLLGNPNGITSVGITNAGSSLHNGTYTNVAAVNITGSGANAKCDVVVAGGVITTVTVTDPGYNYATGDTFKFATGFDGGTAFNEIITITGVSPDYKYLLQVLIGGAIIATIKRVPQPGNSFGVFNIGDIVRNYVSANFNPSPGVLHAQQLGANEFFIEVTCRFGHEFNFEEQYNIVDDTNVYYNHYNGRMLGVNTNLASSTNKVVTSRPLVNYVNRNDQYCFISYFSTAASAFNVVTKPYAGAVLQATNTTSVTPAGAKYLQVFNVATNTIAGITTASTHFTVQINSGAIYTFNITCEAVYTNYTLHFLNKYGGFESRDFSKVSRKTIDITKADYGKLPYTIDDSGKANYYNSTTKVYNQSRSVYASQFKEKMTLNTDILTDEEYTWLGELFISPLVYMEIDGYFVSVAISQSNYEFKKRINDKLTNIQLAIEFGEQFNAQFR